MERTSTAHGPMQRRPRGISITNRPSGRIFVLCTGPISPRLVVQAAAYPSLDLSIFACRLRCLDITTANADGMCFWLYPHPRHFETGDRFRLLKRSNENTHTRNKREG
ncbi:hypothetical protein EVAR_46577_1 [Eumeta japonica]|uniref:Uncharacterized protein n=1 Tax=Eumeta variegata TaxID=151549 RepID=A0A4C1WR32_EUMVA|nr:hypothetical protein EVAR_46577_1 [Eumeta japonica]